MKLTCYYIVSLIIFFSVIVAGEEQKIETVLLSRWKKTSIIQEAAEFIGEVDKNLFWQFCDNVLEKQTSFPIPDNGMYIYT